MDPALLNILVTAAVTLVSYWFAHRNGYQLPNINPPTTPAGPAPAAPSAPLPAASHPVLQEILAILTSVILPKLQTALSQPAPAPAASLVTHEIPVSAKFVVSQPAAPAPK